MLVNKNQEKYYEIPFKIKSNEKYDIYNENICLISNVEGLTLVEYGKNEILCFCPIQYIDKI